MAKVSGELQPLVKDSTQTMKRYLVAKAAFTLREEHIPEEHIERQASHFSSRSSRVLTSGEVVGFGGLWSGGGVRYGTGAAARREFLIANIVTTSKALVTSSDALVPNSKHCYY